MLTFSLCAKSLSVASTSRRFGTLREVHRITHSRDKPKARTVTSHAGFELGCLGLMGTGVIQPVSQTWTNKVSMEVSLRPSTATAP